MSAAMCIEEVKRQIVILHHAIVELQHQDRLESIRFLCDCCDDLRLTYSAYEDVEGGQVLNLTTSHKLQDYVPFFGRSEFDDQFLQRNFNVDHFNDAHDVDFGAHVLEDDPPEYETLDVHDENNESKCKEWPSSDAVNDSSDPVNLVVASKEATVGKKNRRKQMFTKKSVRKLSERNKETKVKENLIKCFGCSEECVTQSDFVDHLKAHDCAPLSCKVCRSQFPNIFLFWRHKEDDKCQDRMKLVCSDCGDRFKFGNHFMKHMHGHKENNCKYCTEKFSNRALSREHMKKVHPDIKLVKDLIPCKFCPMSFPRLHGLYNHYKLHHSKGKFVCTSCGLFLSTKEKHKEHLLEHEKEKKYQCHLCNRKFYAKELLTNHIKMHESGKYKCITCNITVASKSELSVHKRKKHEVRGLEPNFECKVCSKKFGKKNDLTRHASIHGDGPKFSCKHCDKTFNSLGCLQKHEKRKTHFKTANVIVPESKYEKVYEDQLICENCGKQYQTYTQLKYHLRTHKKVYKCDRCDKTFSMKFSLRRHLRLHEGKSTAVCEICGDSFTRLCSLKEHVLIKHSDVRSAQCPICSKSFKRNCELNRHKRIHDSARPYACFCGVAFKQSAHLKSHQKSAHGKGVPPPSDIIDDGLVGLTSTELDREREKLSSLAGIGDMVEKDRTKLGGMSGIGDMLDRDRTNQFVSDFNYRGDHGTLQSLDNFEGPDDYKLHDSFKVEDYGQHMEYSDLHFGAPTAVSPAVDLSVVAISDVVCRDMDAGLSAKQETKETEPSSTIQLVNLSEHIVQEYLLNLH